MLHSNSIPLTEALPRRVPPLPYGSVLAQANRKAEALVTIGPWRVVFIPDDPLPPEAVRSGSPPWAADHGLDGAPQGLEVRRGRLELEPTDQGLPAADRGDSTVDTQALPEGLAWIDVDRAVDEQVDALLGDRHPLLPADPSASPEQQDPQPLQELTTGALAIEDPGPSTAAALSDPYPTSAIGRAPLGSVGFSAVSWALLSQVFWVPLVAVDLHDRWVAHQRDITPPGQPLRPSPIARATSLGLNDLLGAGRPVQELAGQANPVITGALGEALPDGTSGVGTLLNSASSSPSSLLDRPFSVSIETFEPSGPGSAAPSAPALSPAYPANTLLGRAFTRAQLLGGSIGLQDLQEGPMAPLALAERALQRTSDDPLAPLPALWREPMRQALQRLPGGPQQLTPARVVYVPSLAVSSSVEVPLALQSDGSVDVLEASPDPAVLREIEGWSRQQPLPATGSLQPAVVHLHPLPQSAPLVPGSDAASPPRRSSAPASA
ncbi:MAG: hypothetical protein VKO00_08540, partial [Cyanobacteriota bacterium]|nr:hypothetical protein [Cyanobacteriota bacterium]